MRDGVRGGHVVVSDVKVSSEREEGSVIVYTSG